MKIGSGATPKGGESVYLPARIRFALIRSQNVFDRHFAEAGLAFITDVHARGLSSATVEPGDVLLNITGDGVTFGRACLAHPHAFPACVNQHVSIIRLDRSLCLPEYLLCFLTHPAVKRYIESFNAGGSRRAITKGHVESFVVPLPPLREQERIGTALGTLDQEMESNRRMNETLEAMARAIFKSWFVDFDPVRAKAAGRQPAGMDAQTAALFPAAFSGSEVGEVPSRWSVMRLASVVVLSRDTLDPSEYPDEVFDHYSIPAFDQHKLPRAEPGSLIRSNKFLLRPSSVLLSKLNPRIPRVWLPNIDPRRRSVCSTEFLVAEARAGLSREFLYCLLASQAFTEAFVLFATGTSGSHQRVKPDDLLNGKVVTPPPVLVARFTEVTRTMLGRMATNLQESASLAALRDALLPKLLSGEIRVREAEKVIEARV